MSANRRERLRHRGRWITKADSEIRAALRDIAATCAALLLDRDSDHDEPRKVVALMRHDALGAVAITKFERGIRVYPKCARLHTGSQVSDSTRPIGQCEHDGSIHVVESYLWTVAARLRKAHYLRLAHEELAARYGLRREGRRVSVDVGGKRVPVSTRQLEQLGQALSRKKSVDFVARLERIAGARW